MLTVAGLLPSLLVLSALADEPPGEASSPAADAGPSAAEAEGPSDNAPASEPESGEPAPGEDVRSDAAEPLKPVAARGAAAGRDPPASAKAAEAADPTPAPAPRSSSPAPTMSDAAAASPAADPPAADPPAADPPDAVSPDAVPPAVPVEVRALPLHPAAGALGAASFSPEELAKRAAGSVTRVYVERGDMTVEAVGFFVAPDVLAVPHHALELGRRAVFVRPTTGDKIEVTGVVAADASHDLALLQLAEAEHVEPLLPVATEPRLGQSAFLVGVDKRGGLVFVDARVALTGPSGTRLALPESLSLPGAPVLDERGQLIAIAGLGAPVDGLRPAGGAPALRTLMAGLTPPEPLVVWSKAAERADPTRGEAEKVAAASTFTSTAACLTACGTFLCGVPIAVAFAALAVVGCGVTLAVLLGGAAVLTDVIQVLYPTAVVALLVPSVAGALGLAGLAGAVTVTGAGVAAPLALGAAGLVAREVVSEQPWRDVKAEDTPDAQAF